ncbi:hypothetical protein SCHPADRAFT_348102 [Schizopora paradoxa]|uniref:DUF6534 domain-containing protein n=1 Tax=Schizopora paradoxa TaxID=27342 RepID=A0A0H2RWJ1_9AGAM|nr:hypothetical protein SCHPADRAFT_348102 [Schizopora paradoxa]
MLIPLGTAVSGAVFQMITLHSLDELPRMDWVIYSTVFSDMLADISIASTSWLLLYWSSTELSRTTSLFNTLIVFVIGTGSTTVVCDIANAVLYGISRNTQLYMIAFLPLSKLYVNAMLASLNARPMMRRKCESSIGVIIPAGTLDILTRESGSRSQSLSKEIVNDNESPNAKPCGLEEDIPTVGLRVV